MKDLLRSMNGYMLKGIEFVEAKGAFAEYHKNKFHTDPVYAQVLNDELSHWMRQRYSFQDITDERKISEFCLALCKGAKNLKTSPHSFIHYLFEQQSAHAWVNALDAAQIERVN